MPLPHRVLAVALSLAFLAGDVAVCAGWLATPEARMACCSEDAGCPMHKDDSGSPGPSRTLTQAQADACCASSEREPNQSGPTVIVAISNTVLGSGSVLPATVPTLVLSDRWRISAPLPAAPVPKHVLLSVFLV